MVEKFASGESSTAKALVASRINSSARFSSLTRAGFERLIGEEVKVTVVPENAMNSSAKFTAVKAASTIVLLAGIWFFVSPWVYGAYTTGNAWNSWIVGAIMFILGCVRVSRPGRMPGLSWVNALLGIWAFFSPWIFAYTRNTGRFINSLCVGVIVFVLAIVSATFTLKTTRKMSTTPPART